MKAVLVPEGREFRWFYPTLGPTESKRVRFPKDFGYSKKLLEQKSLELTFAYSDLLGNSLQRSMRLDLESFREGLKQAPTLYDEPVRNQMLSALKAIAKDLHELARKK